MFGPDVTTAFCKDNGLGKWSNDFYFVKNQ